MATFYEERMKALKEERGNQYASRMDRLKEKLGLPISRPVNRRQEEQARNNTTDFARGSKTESGTNYLEMMGDSPMVGMMKEYQQKDPTMDRYIGEFMTSVEVLKESMKGSEYPQEIKEARVNRLFEEYMNRARNEFEANQAMPQMPQGMQMPQSPGAPQMPPQNMMPQGGGQYDW